LFSFVFVFRLVSCLTIDSLALLSWVFLVCCFLWVVCWGLQCTACLLRPALVVLLWPASRGLLLFVWFLLVVSRVSVGRVFFAVVFLGCFVLLCVCCSGLAAWLALSLLLSPCSARPIGLSSGAFWSSQCSAGPSLWVSGCICDGPVVMLVAWCVVTAWHLSSLLFMAIKASALCGAPPSTPCCECCFGAPPSCTELLLFAAPLPCLLWCPGLVFGLIFPVFLVVFCFVVGLVGNARCQLTKVTKLTKDTEDDRLRHYTHTLHSAFLPPVIVGGWFVSVFPIGPFFGSWLLCRLACLLCRRSSRP